jgi:hypothetical protein
MSAVSLFDFERPAPSRIFDPIEFLKWSDVLVGAQRTVLIGFRRDELPGHIIYYDEAKRRCGPGGIIPSVEICHEGPIPIDLAFRCILVSSETTLAFRVYPGYQIPGFK